jgi:hypothetical protein
MQFVDLIKVYDFHMNFFSTYCILKEMQIKIIQNCVVRNLLRNYLVLQL